MDTDIALAFPSQDASVHPNFHQFTAQFAADPTLFLLEFLLALDKMSLLGVDAVAVVTHPTECDPGCFNSTSNSTRRGRRTMMMLRGSPYDDEDDEWDRMLQTKAPKKQPRKDRNQVIADLQAFAASPQQEKVVTMTEVFTAPEEQTFLDRLRLAILQAEGENAVDQQQRTEEITAFTTPVVRQPAAVTA